MDAIGSKDCDLISTVKCGCSIDKVWRWQNGKTIVDFEHPMAKRGHSIDRVWWLKGKIVACPTVKHGRGIDKVVGGEEDVGTLRTSAGSNRNLTL